MPSIWSARGPAGGFGTAPDYPFVRPSTDIRGRITDFHLAHDRNWARLPLRLARVVGLGTPSNSSWAPDESLDSSSSWSPGQGGAVIVVDADDTVVFDARGEDVRYERRPWGPDVILHCWRGSGSYCALSERRPPAGDAADLPYDLHPASAILDERCSELTPPHITHFGVGDAAAGPGGVMTLVEGYNVGLSAVRGKSGMRTAFTVTMEAEAGLGSGLHPGCAGGVGLRTLGGARADDSGNLQVNGDGCLLIAPEDGESGLTISGQCGPCCKCSEFDDVQMGIVATHDRLKGEWNRALESVARADAITESLSAFMRSQQSPLRLNLVPYGGRYVDVQSWVRNHNPHPVQDVDILILLGRTDDTDHNPIVVAPYSAYSAPDGGSFAPCSLRAFPARTLADWVHVPEAAQFPYAISYSIDGTLGAHGSFDGDFDPWLYVGYSAHFDAIPPNGVAAIRFTVDLPGSDPVVLKARSSTNIWRRTASPPDALWVMYGSVLAHSSPR